MFPPVQRDSVMASFRQCTAFALCAATAALAVAGCRARPQDRKGGKEMSAETEPVRLEPGHPITRDLAGGGTQSYLVGLKAGQYIQLAADQKGIDVILRLLSPAGSPIIEVDSPNGAYGPERASEVADAAGDYRVEVKSGNAADKPGQYEMRIEELRPATAQDRTRVAAERIYAEAEDLRRQRAWDKATAIYQQARGLWRSIDDRGGEASTLYRVGMMREALGDGDQALDLYAQAIAGYQAARDPHGEAMALNRRGRLLDARQTSGEALASFQQALEVFRKLGELHGQASVLNNIGVTNFNLGKVRPAVEAYEEASGLWKRLGDTENEGKTLLNLGQIYVTQGRLDEARDALAAARQIAERSGDSDALATALNNLGEIDLRQDRLAEARANLEKALALQRQIGDVRGQAITQSSLGMALLKAGDLDGATKAEEAARALFRKAGDAAGEGIALANLGRVNYAHNQDTEAVARLREARTIFERLGDRQGQALSRFGAARSLARLGDSQGARRELGPALDLVESLRGESPGLDFRASYFATKQRYWDLYVEVLMQLHEETLALQASERRRARSLLDVLAETRAVVESQADPGLAAEIQDVEQRLRVAEGKRSSILNADAGNGGNSAQAGKTVDLDLASVESEIRDLLVRLDLLRARMRERNPWMAELAPPAPLAVEEIQKHLLDANTLLLVYSLGEERSFLWAVSPRSVEGYTLPGRERIEAAARQLLDLLPRASREAQVSGQRAAKALADLVLAPAAGRIADFRRLLVVSDGALQLVPFAALPNPAPAEKAAGRDRLLVESHELVDLPSASVLGMLRRREERARRPLEELKIAVIADPVFRADDPRVKRVRVPNVPSPLPGELSRSARDVGLDRLDRLPYTRQEAESILGMVKKGMTFPAFDFDATRELFTSGRLRDFNVLHIATHSLLDSRQPELSGIVFSMIDAAGTPRDGFLRLHEIYNLDLRAGLVVLSACETGAGKEVRGEGLLGLTRAFLSAGVPQLVVSLWKVDDRSTAELMKRFYFQLLEKGRPPADALRQAQLSMLAEPEWSQARNWAGFVFLGDFGRKLDGGSLEATDSGGVTIAKKAGTDLPPPKVAADRPRKKPAGPSSVPPPSEEAPR
jgi:CHAT domain-containing protein/tetratricopeptide (TPR) repeat protein